MVMEYRRFGDMYVLRLEIGEEIVSQLTGFCKAHGIGAGTVAGIGVVRRAKISYFDVRSGQYQHHAIEDYMELTSLMGNISIMEGVPYPHLHATLADKNFNLLGGHLSEAEIGVTGEIVLEPLEGVLERKHYQESGLNLLAVEH